MVELPYNSNSEGMTYTLAIKGEIKKLIARRIWRLEIEGVVGNCSFLQPTTNVSIYLPS
jgi:hypothetical protein